jgi:hypothetical protein
MTYDEEGVAKGRARRVCEHVHFCTDGHTVRCYC